MVVYYIRSKIKLKKRGKIKWGKMNETKEKESKVCDYCLLVVFLIVGIYLIVFELILRIILHYVG